MSNCCQIVEEIDGLKCGNTYKVTQVFIKKNAHLYKGKKICELLINDPGGGEPRRTLNIKAKCGGTILKLLVKSGDKVTVGQPLFEVEVCTHPTILGNICCDCGIVLEENSQELEESKTNGLVSMIHSIPDLKVSREEAKRLGTEDIKHLLDHKKLALLVDLDQTLIHTTNDNIPPKLKDVFHFQLNSNGPWYHTRLRPYAKKFLHNISQYYELHICTFGVREYAHYIAHFLDEEQKLFGDRILSRNECLDPMSKKANLSSLFPCGDNLVCIIDDRTDVWNFAPNVVQVMPYHFFQHTGDINAPPGLQKMENDDTDKGFDFSKLGLEECKENDYQKGANVADEAVLKRKREPDVEESSYIKRQKSEDSIPSSSIKETNEGESNQSASSMNENDQAIFSLKETDEIETSQCTSSVSENDQPISCIKDTDRKNDKYISVKSTLQQSEREEDVIAEKEGGVDESVGSSGVKETDSDVIDVHDNDDFLLYLEDILKRLHYQFFKEYEEKNCLPDLKDLIPKERKKVLSGINLVFSGVIPHRTKLTDSKAFCLAASLGATVSDKIVVPDLTKDKKVKADRQNWACLTTHLISANLHTEKVHQAKKVKDIKIVTPNWLWCCAERWEKVDERLFVLNSDSELTVCRNPPIHCFANTPLDQKEEPAIEDEVLEVGEPQRKNDHYSLFESLNPLAYLSDDEAKSMEEEVDGELDNDDDDDDDEPGRSQGGETSPSEDSALDDKFLHSDTEEDGEDEVQRDIRRSRHSRSLLDEDDYDDDEEVDDEEEELPSIRFRQGGPLFSEESDEEDSADEDMNAYGDILEKELMD